MLIPKVEHDRLAAIPQAEKNTSIQNDVDVIHRCVNSGTVDRDTINDALARISAYVPKIEAKPTAKPLGAPATPHPMYGSNQPTPKPLGTPHATL